MTCLGAAELRKAACPCSTRVEATIKETQAKSEAKKDQVSPGRFFRAIRDARGLTAGSDTSPGLQIVQLQMQAQQAQQGAAVEA